MQSLQGRVKQKGSSYCTTIGARARICKPTGVVFENGAKISLKLVEEWCLALLGLPHGE